MTDEQRMGVRDMLALTAPTLGFATALSLVTSYLPLILQNYTDSATLIGFAIGGEGIFSSLIPLFVGVLSDRIWTKHWGRRRPFMVFAAPFMATSLILAPLQTSYGTIALSTFIFFAAYHFYTSPYQSLLPDVTPPGFHGRVQGFQGLMRGGGMFLGMVVLGVLFGWWQPSPFILCGVLILGLTYWTVHKVQEPEPDRSALPEREGLLAEVRRIWHSIRQYKEIQRFMVATFLWESTLAGLRPFIMLYFTHSLGVSVRTGALLLGLVGVTYLVAALASGFLADRYGRLRMMRVGLWIYLAGCLFGFFVRDVRWTFAFLPIFGLGGSIVLTLPYAILIPLMPKEHIGQFTGLFSMTRGFANILAPVIAGGVIDLFGHYLGPGRQYTVIWLLAAIMIVISLFFFRGAGHEKMVNV